MSDVHGFYTETIQALKDHGFFTDTEPHKLIVCGDMMDRGAEAVQMQEFMYDLLQKDQLIFVRGNHEDLMVEMVKNFGLHFPSILYGKSHHVSNGTFDTAIQLSGVSYPDFIREWEKPIENVRNSIFFKDLIPASINYFETKNYIFVHGWIPCANTNPFYSEFYGGTFGRGSEYNPNWRKAKTADWEDARWLNGMKMAEHYKITEPGKTIVCGHFHTSWGHYYFGKSPEEIGPDADFSPFYGHGVIAIDGCTAYSGMVNCIVLDDE